MHIRQERAADYDAVYRVIKEAFAHAAHSDGNEQDLVVRLRKSGAFVPELSLVAVEERGIAGHILFTKACVRDVAVLALAPLSVVPDYQNRGIGLSLIKAGHAVARGLGYRYSVVLGDPMYYSKAGYVPANRYGIQAPFDVPDENFMAVRLMDGAQGVDGTLRYDAAFGIEGGTT